MRLIRESLRAKKALHKHTKALHEGALNKRSIVRNADGSVSYRFAHTTNENYGSAYELTLTRSDLLKLAGEGA